MPVLYSFKANVFASQTTISDYDSVEFKNELKVDQETRIHRRNLYEGNSTYSL